MQFIANAAWDKVSAAIKQARDDIASWIQDRIDFFSKMSRDAQDWIVKQKNDAIQWWESNVRPHLKEQILRPDKNRLNPMGWLPGFHSYMDDLKEKEASKYLNKQQPAITDRLVDNIVQKAKANISFDADTIQLKTRKLVIDAQVIEFKNATIPALAQQKPQQAGQQQRPIADNMPAPVGSEPVAGSNAMAAPLQGAFPRVGAPASANSGASYTAPLAPVSTPTNPKVSMPAPTGVLGLSAPMHRELGQAIQRQSLARFGVPATVGNEVGSLIGDSPVSTPSATESRSVDTRTDNSTDESFNPGKVNKGAHRNRADVPYDGRPASIRYNNPGAAYPAARDVEYGLEGFSIIGGGHKIGKFPTPVHGLAANMNLWRTQYKGLTLRQAVSKWRDDPLNGKSPLPRGFDPNVVITDEILNDKDKMLSLLSQMMEHEAGKGRAHKFTETELANAYALYDAGGIAGYNEKFGKNSAIADTNTNSKRIKGDEPTAQNSGTKSSVTERQQKVAGVRKLPISSDLKGVLEYAASQAGVEVEVISGGQPKIGTSNNRTGSTRHDLGNAADVDLYVNEDGKRRKLSFRNPADLEIIKKFSTASAAAGATGMGAGSFNQRTGKTSYMGDGRIHVGFGQPAVWGGAASNWLGDAWKTGRKNPVDIAEWRKNGATETSRITELSTDKVSNRALTRQHPNRSANVEDEKVKSETKEATAPPKRTEQTAANGAISGGERETPAPVPEETGEPQTAEADNQYDVTTPVDNWADTMPPGQGDDGYGSFAPCIF